MVRIGHIFPALLLSAASALVLFAGCGSKSTYGGGVESSGGSFNGNGSGDDEGGAGGFGGSGINTGGGGSGSSNGSFVNNMTPANAFCPKGSPVSCYVNKKCGGSATTTITGKVYDPAGKVPLYNVVVWVPNDPFHLPPITPGTSTCAPCDTQVQDYVTATTTTSDGSFTLQGVPTLDNLPIVVQIGKWRRIITVPHVQDCGITTLPDSGPNQARLPKNQMEGDMPQMALLTGGEDDLGCFLMRMGIDPNEYGAPHSAGGKGRLDIYQGLAVLSLNGMGPGLSSGTAGNCTNTSCPLWQSKSSLETYDIVLLACEGNTYDQDPVGGGGGGDGGAGATGPTGLAGNKANVTAAAKLAMHDWLDEGGKVFATHFHYTWFQNGPPDFQTVANWKGYSVGNGTCTNCTVDTSFPKGQALASWLMTAGGIAGNGITLNYVADSVSQVNGQTTRWIYGQSGRNTGATDVKYMSFETPIGGITPPDAGSESNKKYCGKAVFSDLHAGGMPSGAVPGSCKMNDLSEQEKALEFLFFDLSACVQIDTLPPPNYNPTR